MSIDDDAIKCLVKHLLLVDERPWAKAVDNHRDSRPQQQLPAGKRVVDSEEVVTINDHLL